MMTKMPRQGNSHRKPEFGQGLIEFAIVLPVLLVTLMGIADFGRLFAVYSNLFNAAREGTRYGVVNPRDMIGIVDRVRSHVSMLDPAQVDITVQYDSGPGTPAKPYDQVGIGDRVLVTLEADVEMITPLIRAFVQQFDLQTEAARTISTVGDIGGGGPPPNPPTATPDGTTTPSPTPTASDTPTPTITNTPDPAATPTTPPVMAPIQIQTPLWEGDIVVQGTGEPDQLVRLRDIQNPALDLSTTVNPDGTFVFNLPIPLVAGHVITVQGYGSIDYAFVEGVIVPTSTPTPTASPTPTPTPSTQYIDIAPECGPGGATTITVIGHLWPTNRQEILILWDGQQAGQVNPPATDFTQDITVSANSGSHTVRAETGQQGHKYNDSKTYDVPCPVTPTPVPSEPNLVVESITLENRGNISTYDPLTFTVSVLNAGSAPANSLFWVDLYTDPTVEPPTANDLMNEVSVAWAAVSSLAQSDTMSVTLFFLEGFDTIGDHSAYVLADTWEQITERDEGDNVGGPVTVTVSLPGIPPTPTPTPTPGGSQPGAISGSTWLYINGDVVPQGRVNVYLYDGIDLVAETLSDQFGNYLLSNVPPGSYTVIGETYIDSVLYSDIVLDVQVVSGQTTQYVTLVLH